MNGLDMTSGSITKKMTRIAFPILVTNLINMLHNLADMFWLGQVSQDALSAVGAMGLFLWLGISIGALSKTGSEIMISQSYGNKNTKGVNKFATNGLLLAIILAVVYGLVLFISKDMIITMYNFESANIRELSYDYLMFIPFSVFFLIINHQYMSSYNGIGNTKLVFIFVSLGLVINMILDPLFILVLDMSAKGAGLATLIAMISITTMFALYSRFKSDTFENFRANMSIKKCMRLLNLGIVPMIHQVFFTVVFITVSIYIVKYGDVNIAISRIGGQVESLTWIVGAAVTTAITVFTGQNYGVGNYERIAKGVSFMTIVMAIYSVFVTLAFIFFGEEIFLVFLPNASETAVLGATYLLINAPAQIFMMLEAVGTGFFNGQGHTKIPAFASIFGNGIRIPLMIILGNMYGINGVWVAMSLSAISKGLIIIVQFIISIIKNDEYKFKYFILKEGVNNA